MPTEPSNPRLQRTALRSAAEPPRRLAAGGLRYDQAFRTLWLCVNDRQPPNKSLDRSAGSVFRNLIDQIETWCKRCARSTQP